MKICTNTVVTVDFVVTDEKGQVLDTNGDESMEILIGHSHIIPGLEDALLGKEKGDRVDVMIGPDRGYGMPDPRLIQTIDKSLFDGMPLNVGDTFLADTELGQKPIVVKEIHEDHVVVDGNHPLAGKTLKYMVDILEVRDATDSEVEHGHVHGAGGCCGGHHGHGGCCGRHKHHEHHEEHECCCGEHHAHDEEHECCCGHHEHGEEHECGCHEGHECTCGNDCKCDDECTCKK